MELPMDIAFLIRELTDNAQRIQDLVRSVSQEEAVWKSDPDSWSILEVINHLYDEEREDFRVRLEIILHHPDRPWPGIDPKGWVMSRNYNARDPEESLDNFLEERKASLEWLSGLEKPDWDSKYKAQFGSITAGDMFASWVSHDHLHMRQLVELHRFLTVRAAEPYRVDYAGE
jgi:hypothetical protein